MLKRKLYSQLASWKASKKRKAFCIIGARQIGKTTLVREFARNNYEYFAEINFITDSKASDIFQQTFDAETIITNLTAYLRQPLEAGKSLIFFDEIQKCPQVRTAIKFLVEDGRFDYVESGSLLGVNFQDVPSFPVGFEEIHEMYPMDFEEFAAANGVQQETFSYLYDCYCNRKPMSESVHNTMKKLFYTYIVVGGMPEAVQIFVDTHDIGKVINYQNTILSQYRLDIAQYAGNDDKIKIKAIFDSIPSQLDDKNRRFIVSSLTPSARLNRYENSFKWLTDAGVALDPMTGGAIVDDNFETSAAGLFACGNALHIHDLVDFVSDEGDHAGASAARRALRRSVTPHATPPAATSREGSAPTRAGAGVRYIVPQYVHPQTSRVTLRFRTSASFENASIVIEKRLANGEIELVKRRRVLVAVPAEMQSVALAGDAFAGAKEILVRIEPKEAEKANGEAKSGGFDGAENAPKVGGAAKASGAAESGVAAKIAPVSAQGEEASHE